MHFQIAPSKQISLKLLAVWLFVAACVVPCLGKPVRVLFVGNSYFYTDDIPRLAARLAAAVKRSPTLEVGMLAAPGATLQDHWEKGMVVRSVRQGKWDYVVLQEQSTRPIEAPQLFRQYALKLNREIQSAGAKTVLFLTWPRREHPEQLAALTNAYFGVARELKALVVPAGLAWGQVMNEKPSLALYHEDGSHPNPTGSYVAACAVYSVLTQESAVGLPRVLYTVRRDKTPVRVGELSEADAGIIQRAVARAVSTISPTRQSSHDDSASNQSPN